MEEAEVPNECIKNNDSVYSELSFTDDVHDFKLIFSNETIGSRYYECKTCHSRFTSYGNNYNLARCYVPKTCVDVDKAVKSYKDEQLAFLKAHYGNNMTFNNYSSDDDF